MLVCSKKIAFSERYKGKIEDFSLKKVPLPLVSTGITITFTITTIYLYKFTVVYCESVNLIGYITVFYLLIENGYTSVHIARHS